MSGKAGDKRPIIIKREEVVEGGHHGGAWKVAYADFVTAMMAFFLLMWLLNSTSADQRRGLADYFSPMNALSHSQAGSGKPFGGKTPYDAGEMVSDRGMKAVVEGRAMQASEVLAENPDTSQPRTPKPDDGESSTTDGEKNNDATGKSDTSPNNTPPVINVTDAANPNTAKSAAEAAANPNTAKTPADQNGAGVGQKPGGATADTDARVSPDAKIMAMVGNHTPASMAVATRAATDQAALQAEQDRRERASFDSASKQILSAVHGDKLLEDLSKQLAIDQTPEGMRIQLLDEDHKPMFATGSSTMNDRAKLLLQKVAAVLITLPEPITIAGNTDAAPFPAGGKSNWDLSTERANATRRIMAEAGLQDSRIRSVTGNADRDLLLPGDPLAAANRRIAIMVLRTPYSSKGVPPL